MSKTRDTSPDAPDFTDSGSRNKPAYTYKGGSAPDSALLSGLIEPESETGWFGSRTTNFEVFLTKRQIGGKKVNGRKIKGWKEVPTVLDWDSTYRHSEWFKNFRKLAEMFADNELSDLFHSGDLNDKEMAENHSLCVFINSFLQLESKWMDEKPDVEDLIPLLSDAKIVENHAEEIYLNDEYEERDSEKRERIKINGESKVVKYNEFKLLTYEQIVEIWFDYLEMMEKMKVYQANMSGEELLVLDPEHRWTERYTNKMLAKFKDLEDSRFSDMWTTMLTLTTYQDKENGEPMTPENWQKNRGASWFEAMERLKKSLDKTLDVLRQIARRELETNFHYVWIVEAHETGFPHIHVAIFGDVSEWLNTYTNELRIKNLLENEYDLGKEGVATTFETKPPSGDGAINNMSNYLMKYFKKNFGEIKSKYESEDLDDKDWGTLVYNACMWLSGYRTWGTSKEVGSVMKTNRNDSGKEYNNLGGELTDETDKEFETTISAKGDELLNKRLKERKRLRKAIEEREQS